MVVVPPQVALLRAINVGGHVVKMDRLRMLFEQLGLSAVETFIASGNVIFESRVAAHTLETRIGKHLRDSLGFEVATFIRSPVELAAVAGHDPFPGACEDGEGVLQIGFLKERPTVAAVARLLSFRTGTDDFHVHEREVYWSCRTRTSESSFFKVGVEKALGMTATTRNVTTVRKLAAKCAAEPVGRT